MIILEVPIYKQLLKSNYQKDELKGFNKQALKAMNYDNKQLALPAIVETTALFYNKKLVKNAPQTLEEVEANAAKLTDSKNNTVCYLMLKISILIIRFIRQ